MVKVAVLFSNYGPYHISRVNALDAHCKKIGWDLIGIELARYEKEYDWKTDTNNLPFKLISVLETIPLEEVKPVYLLIKLISVLNKVKPDIIVIAGYFHYAMLATLMWGLWNNKPAVLLSETTEYDVPRSKWREAIKSWIVTKYKSALAGGNPHKRYLIKLGLPADSIFLGYDVVGNDTFHPDNIKHLSRPLDKPYFLSINRFVAKKNLLFLLSCYAVYRQIQGEEAWDLVLCGDGQLRSIIEEQIDLLGLKKAVHLPGFLQQHELLPYFAHANCFIHASIQEQWGLVVNEAMAAGLPVLVSNHCGCCEDLVIEGVNGFSFDPEKKEELTQLMLKISSSEVDLQAMGKAALLHIENFSPDYFAENLIQAIKTCL
ncbi:MAG: glycosyltransferase family 4 protein [Scytonematopsis contorta HA4267-MV1]|jgi:glycosyltransferase involved in cell wall biosynthesis|nr:glycosyltransferase family 4 protein [Scytonematopsis contorta HA4267-MV1]